MLALGIILFLVSLVVYGIERTINGVHLAKLQDISLATHSRALKSLAYRREQSLLIVRSILFLSGSGLFYVVAREFNYLLAAIISLAILAVIVFVGSINKILEPLILRLLIPFDAFVRRYESILNKLSKYLFIIKSDEKIYRPYDDKEFKKLIKSLHSSNNVINKRSLTKIENLLAIENKDVEELMTPMNKVHVVAEDDYVGPILLDELHKTQMTIFPVSSEGRITGSVRLADIVDYTGKAQVKDFAKKEVNYINKDESLQSLIELFLEYNSEQFLVIDDKENIKGVVNVYQVLQLLFDQNSEKV